MTKVNYTASIFYHIVTQLQAHCHYWVVKNFVDQIRKAGASPSSEKVLTQLCQLYALYGIVQNSGEFLEVGLEHFS